MNNEKKYIVNRNKRVAIKIVSSDTYIEVQSLRISNKEINRKEKVVLPVATNTIDFMDAQIKYNGFVECKAMDYEHMVKNYYEKAGEEYKIYKHKMKKV